MTEGEVCPDNKKSGSIWPLVAVWMPDRLPYGQKLASTFPDPACSAIIRLGVRSHLGNVGSMLPCRIGQDVGLPSFLP